MLIQGRAKWAKVIGEPGWGYGNKFKEWSIDVYVDEETAHKLEVEGLKDKIKDRGNGQYITFKRKELKTGGPQVGEKNAPIRVVDHRGEPWGNQKIGNGSTVNVNFAINEYKPGVFNTNILSMQVWDLVPYEGGEFPVREDLGAPSSVEDWSNEVVEEPTTKAAK